MAQLKPINKPEIQLFPCSCINPCPARINGKRKPQLRQGRHRLLQSLCSSRSNPPPHSPNRKPRTLSQPDSTLLCSCLRFPSKFWVFSLGGFLEIIGVFASFPGASAGARRTRRMAGKGGKGLIAAKTAAGMDKEKKQPVTRSSRAGLQVTPFSSPPVSRSVRCSVSYLA